MVSLSFCEAALKYSGHPIPTWWGCSGQNWLSYACIGGLKCLNRRHFVISNFKNITLKSKNSLKMGWEAGRGAGLPGRMWDAGSVNQLGQRWQATCRGSHSWDDWPPEFIFASVREPLKYVHLVFILAHEHIFLLIASLKEFSFSTFSGTELWIIWWLNFLAGRSC